MKDLKGESRLLSIGWALSLEAELRGLGGVRSRTECAGWLLEVGLDGAGRSPKCSAVGAQSGAWKCSLKQVLWAGEVRWGLPEAPATDTSEIGQEDAA